MLFRSVGMASDIFPWNALDGVPYVAVGTNRKVYVFYGGAWADITPIRDTLACTFDTTSGSATVTVNCTAHEAIPGDFVTLDNVTGDPGGIPNASLENEFEVQAVLTDNAFTILSPVQASSTATAAGTADAEFQIHVGSDKSFVDFGWGTGTWGLSSWGTPRPASSALTLTALIWQFDNYGQNLIMQQVDGGIYEWNPS